MAAIPCAKTKHQMPSRHLTRGYPSATTQAKPITTGRTTHTTKPHALFAPFTTEYESMSVRGLACGAERKSCHAIFISLNRVRLSQLSSPVPGRIAHATHPPTSTPAATRSHAGTGGRTGAGADSFMPATVPTPLRADKAVPSLILPPP